MAEIPMTPPDGMYPWREIMEIERFGEAWQLVRDTLAYCETQGISNEAVMAALFSELLPRMVAHYGPQHVAATFGRMANMAAQAIRTAKHIQ